MKIYRGTDGDTEPVEMECDAHGYPNATSTGEIMYENTHFKTEAEAWDSIAVSVKAMVELTGIDVRDCQARLGRAHESAGEAARDFALANRKFDEWKRNKEMDQNNQCRAHKIHGNPILVSAIEEMKQAEKLKR